MTSRIVILIPAYKCETTILQTLESIQKQGPALDEIQQEIISGIVPIYRGDDER